MKIATWNIERLKHVKKLDVIHDEIETIDSDILILTESDTRVVPDYPFSISTSKLQTDYYKDTERRVSIFSKFEIIRKHDTYDDSTAVCPEIKTPAGNLLVYGTIIGIHGNRRTSFREDLEKQLLDFSLLGRQNLCVAGDYNLSFSDNYYYTKFGRDSIVNSFLNNSMLNLTARLPEAIDHIGLSEDYIDNRNVSLTEWNLDKSLSDHKGVCVHLH